MPTNYLPTREDALALWAANAAALFTASPETYGLTAAQAAGYAGARGGFQELLGLVSSDQTRTPSLVVAKQDSKKYLVSETRRLVRIVQAFPGTTNQMRSDLGITIPDATPTPAGPPTSVPDLDVTAVMSRTIKLRIRDSRQPDRRARPAGVRGVMIYSAVGPVPPADLAGWHGEGLTARTTIDIEFPPSTPPGAQVWLTACWVGSRMLTGDACEPITTRIPGALQAAA